jgi:hypothetical protein
MAPNKAIPANEEEWLECIALNDGDAMIPTGCIRRVVGPEMWVDGNGAKYTTDGYIKRWGFDPHEPWAAIKAYRKANGGGVKVER